MTTIYAPTPNALPTAPFADRLPIVDVTARIACWGRRGIFLGANFGFVFGAVLVAIPFSTDALAFGVAGTLAIGTIECAAVAGAFAAFGAALYGSGFKTRNFATRRIPAAPVDLKNAFPLPDTRNVLTTLDAWEYGNTGP